MANPSQLTSETRLPSDDTAPKSGPGWHRLTPRLGFLLWLVVWTVLFARPLFHLFNFSARQELYSHLLLMPFMSGYLLWVTRSDWNRTPARPAPWLGALSSGLSLLPLLAAWMDVWGGWPVVRQDQLFLYSITFVLLIASGLLLFFGPGLLGSIAVPVILLAFLAPFPAAAEAAIERFFQHASAGMAGVLFSCLPFPVVLSGLTFQLPNIVLEVAPECSGIRSTLVLFITSLAAGWLFLRTPSRRALLALFVIPLGILRNAVRIVTIGSLCVYVSPDMIHSWIHHRGGPVFFVLSLVPFFLFLALLRRSEAQRRAGEPQTAPAGRGD